MQWRAIGQLCDIPFNTLFTLFARWTRLGLWRRLLDRGVLVRDVGIPHHLRVTAGTEAETTAFLTALAEVLGETGDRS